jgi:3-phenylpropionate/cinnamic acid dioxygenase small subunit
MSSRYDDEHEIRNVLYRYCRGVDRRDFDLVRSCYHPDATDDHGSFVGGVDDFIAFITKGLQRYEQTMHVIANVLIDVQGDVAHSEAYTLAFHRVRETTTKPVRDYTVGLRYVDRFERRGGAWAIADRVCAFSFQRIDPCDPPMEWMPGFTVAKPTPDDVIHRPFP